jgi:hypothetical protein
MDSTHHNRTPGAQYKKCSITLESHKGNQTIIQSQHQLAHRGRGLPGDNPANLKNHPRLLPLKSLPNLVASGTAGGIQFPPTTQPHSNPFSCKKRSQQGSISPS